MMSPVPACLSLSEITMGCGAGKYVDEAKRKRVVVFGVGGRQGRSVLKSVSADVQFKVIGVSKLPFSPGTEDLLKLGHAIVDGDMDDMGRLREILREAYGCFIVTNYWEHFDITRDAQQGKNAVDCAVEAGVKHIVFSGQESPKAVIDKCCDPFDSKRRVEEHLKKKQDVNFTVVRLPFLYDNLLSMVKPHAMPDGSFAIAYPMGDVPLDGMAVEDVGKCVHKIFQNPNSYRRRMIRLSGDQLTVQEYTDVLNKRLAPKLFINPKISLNDFNKFSFKGSKEILSMFTFYKVGRPFRDIKATKKLHKGTMSFDEWVVKYERELNRVTEKKTEEETM